MTLLTFRDRKESNRHDTVTVRPTDIIVDVADRHVHRMVLLIPCTNGDGRLVCTEDDGGEHGAMVERICSKNILCTV